MEMEIYKSTGISLLKLLWCLPCYPIFSGECVRASPHTAFFLLPVSSLLNRKCVEKPLKRENNVTKLVGQQLSPLALCILNVDWGRKQTKKIVLGVRHLAGRKEIWVHLPQNFSLAVQALA